MSLFSPLRVGALELPNRIVMAPMARSRCNENRAANGLVAEYYAQRASAGLLITEAGSVSPFSVSRPCAAAIFTAEQAEGWSGVAEAVHAAGGRIFQQIYHLGRKADPSRMPDGSPPVAPSAIAAAGQISGVRGTIAFGMPRALATSEIPGIVAEFRAAAENARRAGMDGVEIHGANGYLIDQFLRSGTNLRTDQYGGGIENRARFLLEVTDAVVSVFGADRVGVRFSPHATGDGIADANPVETWGYAAEALNARKLAYIHLIESLRPGLRQSPSAAVPAIMPVIRKAFAGPLIVNGGYGKAEAEEALQADAADLVSFGTPYIGNPDLVERFAANALLNEPDPATFYFGGAKGYTDYSTLEVAAAG